MEFQRRARAANKTILIIDDDESIRKSISMHLEDNFYKTLTAENGREGIEIFDQTHPDLVLVDLRMPEVDGYEVIKYIYKSAPEVPLIVVSGVNSIQAAIDTMKIGAWDFLTKPVTDHSVLIHSIEKGLDHADLFFEKQKADKKFYDLFNTVSDYLYSYDLNGYLIEVNQTFKNEIGYSEDVLDGVDAREIMSEELIPGFEKSLKEILIKKKDEGNFQIRSKNGKVLFVEYNNTLVYDDAGKPAFISGSARDVTLREQAEKEKKAAKRHVAEQEKKALVGQIAGKLAHDFNNILGAIMGRAQLSLLHSKNKKVIQSLQLIVEQSLRGKSLTQNLVAFAKNQEPRQETIEINNKIDLVLNLMERDLEGAEIVRDYKASIPTLIADPGMIEHVLVNIIQNSVHAMSKTKSPKLILRTYYLNGKICIELEDNGCGIPLEHHNDIYTPSFTLKGGKDVSQSYGDNIKGTGYGMANVKNYVEKHKGEISFKSVIGKGTQFTLALPLIKKELTGKEIKEVEKTTIHKGKNILLVEDEKAISDVQSRVLSREPFKHKVDIAGTGHLAIKMFKENDYDFISLDYLLPGGLNGMDVYNQIRDINKAIPILFVSGNIEFLESIEDLRKKDPNLDHLSKPCQNKDYVESINRLFTGSKS
ncbi:MAG: response regulator [Desulfobacteraceae bacterium]|nr:response regulator [Desulfobacteraceae bacterium]